MVGGLSLVVVCCCLLLPLGCMFPNSIIPNYLCRDYCKAKAYTFGVHGPLNPKPQSFCTIPLVTLKASLGLRIRGTLGDIDPLRSHLRELQAGFRRGPPLKGPPNTASQSPEGTWTLTVRCRWCRSPRFRCRDFSSSSTLAQKKKSGWVSGA